MQETINPLDTWHRTITESDPSGLYEILDDSFQFFSPAIFKSKEKYMGYIYLLAASQAFLTSDFKYTKKIIDNTCLTWKISRVYLSIDAGIIHIKYQIFVLL